MAFENNTVNQRIAGYRKLAGLTQEDAAKFLNMKRNTYARMEKYGNPSPEMLKKLSELYNVSVNVLLYGKEENPYRSEVPKLVFGQPSFSDILPLSILETNAIRMFRTMTKEDAQKIIDYFNKVYMESKKR